MLCPVFILFTVAAVCVDGFFGIFLCLLVRPVGPFVTFFAFVLPILELPFRPPELAVFRVGGSFGVGLSGLVRYSGIAVRGCRGFVVADPCHVCRDAVFDCVGITVERVGVGVLS